LVGDSGGKARAPLRELHGADHVARFLTGVAGKGVPDVTVRFLEVNGGPAVLVLSGGRPDSVFQVDVADGRIQTLYIIRNPDKLRSLALIGERPPPRSVGRPARSGPAAGLIGIDQGCGPPYGR